MLVSESFLLFLVWLFLSLAKCWCLLVVHVLLQSDILHLDLFLVTEGVVIPSEAFSGTLCLFSDLLILSRVNALRIALRDFLNLSLLAVGL